MWHNFLPSTTCTTELILGPRIIELDCEEVWRQLSDYIDAELDPALRDSMSAHFENCAHCTAILDGTRNVVELLADGKAFELPKGMSNRLYAKLNQHLSAEKM